MSAKCNRGGILLNPCGWARRSACESNGRSDRQNYGRLDERLVAGSEGTIRWRAAGPIRCVRCDEGQQNCQCIRERSFFAIIVLLLTCFFLMVL
jgi:hypothetical protein